MQFSKYTLIKSFLSENKLYTFLTFSFSVLSSLFILIVPLFIGKFYQIITKSDSARGELFQSIFGDIEMISSFIFLFLTILIIKFVLGYFQTFCSGILNESFSKYLRELLFRRQLESKLTEFEKKDSGAYLLRYSGDLRSISKFFSLGLLGLTSDIIFTCFTLIVFFSISQELTLFIIFFLLFIFIVSYFINKKLKQINKKKRDIKSQILNFVSKRLSTMLTIKSMNRINVENSKFIEKSNLQYQVGKSYLKWSALFQNFLPFSLYFMLVILLLLAYNESQSSNQVIDGAKIIVLIMLTINIIPVFKRILRVNMIWQTGDISLSKYLEIINYRQEIFRSYNDVPADKSESAILTVSISFSYNSSFKLLDNFSIELKEPGIYYLTGKGGSGKSTFLKLLMGIYDPQEGNIQIFGHDLTSANKKEVRKKMAYASDEATLLGDTIFECVSYSRKDENKLNVVRILEKIGFLKKNDPENHTIILRKNKGLSESEEKALILCRAILMDKKILLLDEPFKGLSNELKTNLISMLYEMSKDKFIFIAATDMEPALKIKKLFNLSQ
ncbi:MAG TPA: hypothetical protein DEF82_05095 [Crocinitomicaceae bacterium]|nr:ABC transporter ATP-binding protein [Flavobacteriales bacterium]HBW86120.1 hypothetical protein [Crocinitomicaceae bacterium]